MALGGLVYRLAEFRCPDGIQEGVKDRHQLLRRDGFGSKAGSAKYAFDEAREPAESFSSPFVGVLIRILQKTRANQDRPERIGKTRFPPAEKVTNGEVDREYSRPKFPAASGKAVFRRVADDFHAAFEKEPGH